MIWRPLLYVAVLVSVLVSFCLVLAGTLQNQAEQAIDLGALLVWVLRCWAAEAHADEVLKVDRKLMDAFFPPDQLD